MITSNYSQPSTPKDQSTLSAALTDSLLVEIELFQDQTRVVSHLDFLEEPFLVRHGLVLLGHDLFQLLDPGLGSLGLAGLLVEVILQSWKQIFNGQQFTNVMGPVKEQRG